MSIARKEVVVLCDESDNLDRELWERDISFPCFTSSNRQQTSGTVPKYIPSQITECITPEEYGEHSVCISVNSETSRSLVVLEEAPAEDKKSISQFMESYPPQGELKNAKSAGRSSWSKEMKLEETALRPGEPVLDKNSLKVIPSSSRSRSSAIDIKTVNSPGGKFVSENQFYTQSASGEWEIVCVEDWNPWNGTWQVRGSDDKTFAANPIALKTKSEYDFLARDRHCSPRFFGSLKETPICLA